MPYATKRSYATYRRRTGLYGRRWGYYGRKYSKISPLRRTIARRYGTSLGSYNRILKWRLAGNTGFPPTYKKPMYPRIFGSRSTNIYRKKAMGVLGTQSITVNKGHHSTLVTREEFIVDISGSAAFNNTAFRINAADSDTFPWLSAIAENFEFYQFKKLEFMYKTSSGEVVSGTNPAIGKVMLATNFDASEPPFQSKYQMENYTGCASGPAYQNTITHTVNLSTTSRKSLPIKSFYTSPAPPTQLSDRHLYDLGTFQIATSGMPSINVVGELWVRYSCELSKPVQIQNQDFFAWTNVESNACANSLARPSEFFGFVESINSSSRQPNNNATMRPNLQLMDDLTGHPILDPTKHPLFHNIQFEARTFGGRNVANVRILNPGKYRFTFLFHNDQGSGQPATTGISYRFSDNILAVKGYDRNIDYYSSLTVINQIQSQNMPVSILEATFILTTDPYTSDVLYQDGIGGIIAFQGLQGWVGETDVMVQYISDIKLDKSTVLTTHSFVAEQGTGQGVTTEDPPNNPSDHIIDASPPPSGADVTGYQAVNGDAANNLGNSGTFFADYGPAIFTLDLAGANNRMLFTKNGEFEITVRWIATTLTGFPTWSSTGGANIQTQTTAANATFSQEISRAQVQITDFTTAQLNMSAFSAISGALTTNITVNDIISNF